MAETIKRATVAEAYSELLRVIAVHKTDDALRRVTVVVSGFRTARDVILCMGRAGGFANVSVLTADQLVADNARGVLAPRSELPFPVLEASVRSVLSTEPGLFADVADQPVTGRSLAEAARTLSRYPSLCSDSSLSREVIRIHDAAVGRLRGRYHLPHEAVTEVTRRVESGRLGSLVVFLPAEAEQHMAQFQRALTDKATTIDVSATVDPTVIVHASDADDEVRSATRAVSRALAEGTPGHRIGVYYGDEATYLPLLHRHMGAAGIAICAAAAMGLADGAAAWSLSEILSWDPLEMPRHRVLSVLGRHVVRASAPDGSLSVRQAEILTCRDAPVISGTDWHRLEEVPAEHPRSGSARALIEFVREVSMRLTELASASTWGDASDGLVALIDDFFTGRAHDGEVPALREFAGGLADLDGIAPGPTMPGIAAALAAAVDGARGRVGDAAAAVSVGPVAEGAGRDLEMCVVVGLAEGIVPSSVREDPLVPSTVTGTGPQERLRREHRALALALASGRRERIAMFPRGSLRGGADRVPSRWLLDAMTRLAGRPVRSASWQDDSAGCPDIVVVPSFDGALLAPPRTLGVSPSTPAEWRVRALASAPKGRRPTVTGDAIIERGIRLRRDRTAGRFTRFTGNLADVADMIDVFDDAVAPTRLEEWVSSPYLYFIQRQLGAMVLPDPDDDVEIDALRRGDLIHAVLETYVQEVIDGEPGELDRLLAIADSESAGLAGASPGWLPQLWEREAAGIREDLAQWHRRDDADRRRGWHPVAVEQSFGGDGQTQVELTLSGASVRFTGMIDRIDRHDDGRMRVTDYKTGAKRYYEALGEADPTAGCTRFQLGVYGALARSLAGDGPVSARYWFVTGKGGFGTVGYPVTEEVSRLLTSDLGFVHDSIRAGMFPPRPGSLAVAEIADVIGHVDLSATWTALQRAPELADFIARVEGGQ